jgi:hypothetical protein
MAGTSPAMTEAHKSLFRPLGAVIVMPTEVGISGFTLL